FHDAHPLIRGPRPPLLPPVGTTAEALWGSAGSVLRRLGRELPCNISRGREPFPSRPCRHWVRCTVSRSGPERRGPWPRSRLVLARFHVYRCSPQPPVGRRSAPGSARRTFLRRRFPLV